MYCERCTEEQIVPAKLHKYRQVFNTEYNISFHYPKKDRCDICEIYDKKVNRTTEDTEKYQQHRLGKLETKEERASDRMDTNACVVCFDMQNVYSLPKANVSNFFYKRKLTVFHLTAHCSLSKQAYGCLWPETMSGRSANDIASAMVVILRKVVTDHPTVTKLILWSDSCVPQNKNSIMSTAIKCFMQSNPSIEAVVQKFCEAGHSEIQEIDCIHSQLEKATEHTEIYSPVGLVRILARVPRKQPIRLYQMRATDMFDYQHLAKRYMYQNIPYTKVKSLQYTSDKPSVVSYRTGFNSNWIEKEIAAQTTTRNNRGGQPCLFLIPMPKLLQGKKALTAEKIADIKSMIPFMPEQDKTYMSSIV
jgi:hypothetical protein